MNKIFNLKKKIQKIQKIHNSFNYLRLIIISSINLKNSLEKELPNGNFNGELKNSETICLQNNRPFIGGLFCEQIFGPIKNWTCQCGKYVGFLDNKICENCNVELIDTRVRRYRMGYINLITPITHIWYLNENTNYILFFLQAIYKTFSSIDLENIIYLKTEIPDLNENQELYSFFNPLLINQDLEEIYKSSNLNYNSKQIISSELIKIALTNLNLKFIIKNIRLKILLLINNKELFLNSFLLKQLRIIESFLLTKTNPSWMILTILSIIPPTLRPILQLENGKYIATDINEIYKFIFFQNFFLFNLYKNYKYYITEIKFLTKSLQEGIDALFDNSKGLKKKNFYLNNNLIKGLTQRLSGKQGRFRFNLLGKRINFSGRSVIIPEPLLKINQCGIPFEILFKIFQPLLFNNLFKKYYFFNTSQILYIQNCIFQKKKPIIWNILTKIIKNYIILLNRAPTLHRYSVQAFNPIITLGKVIQLHPLLCAGFNADFDGDQMAVHLPLYFSTQFESKNLIKPIYNLLSLSNGEVILKPSQDIIIGCYYLTLMFSKNFYKIYKWFLNLDQAFTAFYQKKIFLHTPILIKYPKKNLKLFIIDNKIKLTNIFLNKKIIEIKIFKLFKINNSINKYFLLTNCGIFICYLLKNNTYEIIDFFHETTIGRLLFENYLLI